MKNLIFIVSLLLFSMPAWAWNAEGHRVIAEIAYQKLSPGARDQIDNLTQIQDKKKLPKRRFLMLSVWPDKLRFISMNAFNSWHFIRLSDPLWTKKPQVVWAIEHSLHMLKTSQTQAEKVLWLSFLMHFVGDIHQPLHCSNRDDFGGNSVAIHSGLANNLHQYWDRGLGLLLEHSDLASMLNQYHFSQATIRQPVLAWARESADLADKFAYALSSSGNLSSSYHENGQKIVKKQLALAGNRLAMILSEVFL